jgi:hypothetical protein
MPPKTAKKSKLISVFKKNTIVLWVDEIFLDYSRVVLLQFVDTIFLIVPNNAKAKKASKQEDEMLVSEEDNCSSSEEENEEDPTYEVILDTFLTSHKPCVWMNVCKKRCV